MARISATRLILISTVLLLTFLAGCSSSNSNSTPTLNANPTHMSAMELAEDVIITIGDLSDITGPGANALSLITMALEDMVGYYNEHDLIPGVELEVITYDGQFDPSRDIPGYEWLQSKDVDLIYTAQPSVAITLKHRLEKDEMVLFTLAVTEDVIEPPGYVLAPGSTLSKYQSYTLLKWIAENDPDFPKNRPAKIGGACWAQNYGTEILAAAEEYAEAHPEQYEWEGGFVTPFTFVWTAEVEALKDCDYVFPPGLMNNFVNEYRTAGYTAKFIGSNLQASLMGMLDDAELWKEVDGMVIILPCWWWTDEGEVIDLAKSLLQENHFEEAEEIMRMGSGYATAYSAYVVLELIADAVEAVGAENFSSRAVLEAAKSFSLSIDGIETDTFSETKRTSSNHLGMYEIRAAEKNIFRLDPEPIPIVYKP